MADADKKYKLDERPIITYMSTTKEDPPEKEPIAIEGYVAILLIIMYIGGHFV